MPRLAKATNRSTGANLGFEEKLWQAADKMRGHMDPGEYKHVALGLIFLKYISDAFEERRLYLEKQAADPASPFYVKDASARYKIPEDRDEYVAENVFWVPRVSRWSYLQDRAKQPAIGKLIDDAMVAIEKENPSLKGVLPKDYARPSLDKQKLGELIDLIGKIGLGDAESRSKDILGRVYEYFLSKFASAEGKKGGEFYTPRCVVRILVEMIEPYKGRVYDPCCGSSGMFVQSEEFIRAHGGRIGDISIYGQESNPTTWRLAKMNLALRGIEANLGPSHADTFHNDLHKDLKADFILANPPFNMSDWGGQLLRNDVRWKYGTPPASNANFAWVQHIVHHLAPRGVAGFVLGDASLAGELGDEAEIRKHLVEADLVDCVISLPDLLFYTTPNSVSIWILSRQKNATTGRKRAGETLFIDARALGELKTRTHRELGSDDIARIVSVYRSWKSNTKEYRDVPGFAMATQERHIRECGFSLLPARYVGVDAAKHAVVPIRNGSAIGDHRRELIQDLQSAVASDKRLLSAIAEIDPSRLALPRSAFRSYKLGELLERSDHRLGNSPEPEILTCTEKAGLILQRERFSKRIATADTSDYKLVRRTDIVFNPYLLWAGAIDQCWIVDTGITSPAYEVLRVRPEFDATLVGRILTSPIMIARYSGISVGTVRRRRRAPVERFLELEVLAPLPKFQQRVGSVLREIQERMVLNRAVNSHLKQMLGDICASILTAPEENSKRHDLTK